MSDSKTIPARMILSLVPHTVRDSGKFRFNHANCPAGEDSKRRLYITVPEDNPRVRLAHCFNCGSSGFAKVRRDSKTGYAAPYMGGDVYTPNGSTSHVRAKISQRNAIGGWGSPSDYIKDTSSDPEMWPERATKYLALMGVGTADIKTYNIRWSDNLNRLAYPNSSDNSFGADGHDVGEVGKGNLPTITSVNYRSIYRNANGPKSIIWNNPCAAVADAQVILARDTTTEVYMVRQPLVIVEDFISAIRVHSAYHKEINVLPLSGASLSTDALYAAIVRCNPGSVIVWLDNDNVTVHKSARQIVERAEMLVDTATCRVSRVEETYEPKHVSNDRIRGVLQNV